MSVLCTAPVRGHASEQSRSRCPACGPQPRRAQTPRDAKGGLIPLGRGWSTISETRDEDGLLHSFDDAPSRTVHHGRTSQVRSEWHRHGVLHREGDQPAVEARTVYGQIAEHHWLRSGEYGRAEVDAPCVIRYDTAVREVSRRGRDSLVVEEMRWTDARGVLHREDGPAVINVRGFFDTQGLACKEAWFRGGVLHREDGPAVTLAGGGGWRYFSHGVEVDERQLFGLRLGIHQDNAAARDLLGDTYTLAELGPESPEVLLALSVHRNP